MALTLNFFHMGMSNTEVALRFMGIYEAQFRGWRRRAQRCDIRWIGRMPLRIA